MSGGKNLSTPRQPPEPSCQEGYLFEEGHGQDIEAQEDDPQRIDSPCGQQHRRIFACQI